MNTIPAIDYTSIFESLPGLHLILSPNFTITAVSDAYLDATMTQRASLLGNNVFDDVLAFYAPANTTPAVAGLEESLNTVLKSGKPHKMQARKYTIRRPGGSMDERYWAALNSPVFDKQHKLAYIIHSLLEDVETAPLALNLATSGKDYQLLVDSVRDYAIIMVDPEGLVASWNSGAESINGYKAEEIIGKPIDLFYTEEDVKQKVPQLNLQMALKYGHYQAEGLRVRKDGTSFWANIVFTALKDGTGAVYGFSKITRDITERRKSREQLESLSRQINQSNDAIFTTDTQRRIMSWNKGAEIIYGYSSEEAIGKNVKDILKTTRSGNNDESIVLNDLEKLGYWSGERIRKTKSGKNIYVRSSISAIKDDNGIVTGFVGVSFDITLQKQLGEQITHLASIVDQSSEAIISRGLDQRIITWNKGAENLLGYSSTEAIGKTARELGMIKFTDAAIAELEEHVFEKECWTFERKFYHKNGSALFAAVTANTVRNGQGQVSSLVFILKDISVRRQLEQRLKKYNEKLEEEIKERTEDVVKSEKRYRTLIENNHDIIVLVDPALKIFYRSPSSTRITGWTDEDVLWEDVTANMHPDDRAMTTKLVSVVMASPGKPVHCVCRTRHKAGHYLWLEGVVINLLHDETVNAMLFNFRDVTERMEAQMKLAKSENLFRALIENSNDIISLMDESFKLVYRSPAAARITGWTNEDMLGIIATKNIHPDDKPAAAAIVKDIMANPAKTIACKFRMQHKKGHYLWVEGTFTNLLHDQYIKAIVFNFRDVTKRVEAENTLREEQLKFSRIAAISPGLIYSFRLAPDGVMSFPYASHAFEELFGVPFNTVANDVGIIINASYQQDKEILISSIAKSAKDLSPWQLQFRYNHPKKGIVWLEGSSIPTREADGSVLWYGVIADVTERKMTEDKINEQHLRLKSLSDNIPGTMFYQMTGDSFQNRRFSYVSSSVTQLTGKTPEEIVADPAALYNLVLEEDVPGMVAAERESFTNMTPFNFEIRCMDFKGNPRWFNIISTPRKLNNGVVVWDGLQLDITAKKTAERQKDFDTNNLNALINNTQDLMWSVDKDFKLITSNEAFDRLVISMTGRKPEKGHNLLFEEFSTMQLEQYRNYYERAFSGETFAVIEHNGQEDGFWSEISFYPIYERQSVIGTACYSRNITEKKKSEQELQKSFDEKHALAIRMSAILNTLPANIALLDAKGYIIEVNDAWRKFAEQDGFEGSNYGIGDNYLEISGNAFGEGKENGKKVREGIKSVLANRVKEFVFEYACHSTEAKRWFKMVATPLQDKEYSGAVIMHIDITELRILEQERLKAKTEEQKIITKAILTGQERERNYIGRELHDNINQILTGTKIYLSLAGHKNKEVEELIKYPMELIDASIKEIRLLCHDMVTPLNNIHLQELLGDLINKLQQTEKTKAGLIYAMPDGILSEELQLNIYRIIQELVNNIIKYAEAEYVTVIVEAKDNNIHITVRDDGKGFDTTKKRNGIGISNIINRVESFGGTITIESTPGNGCKTSMDIPLNQTIGVFHDL